MTPHGLRPLTDDTHGKSSVGRLAIAERHVYHRIFRQGKAADLAVKRGIKALITTLMITPHGKDCKLRTDDRICLYREVSAVVP